MAVVTAAAVGHPFVLGVPAEVWGEPAAEELEPLLEQPASPRAGRVTAARAAARGPRRIVISSLGWWGSVVL
jgi:hypothetical protein